MASGLILAWVVIGGFLMLRYRDSVTAWVQASKLDWRLKFILFSTLLAMVEEAVTTGMTNTAPLMGLRIGQAYVTASANYIDVIRYVELRVRFDGLAARTFGSRQSKCASAVLVALSGSRPVSVCLYRPVSAGWGRPSVFSWASQQSLSAHPIVRGMPRLTQRSGCTSDRSTG